MDLKHDVYTIPILCILRIVIILFLKLKDIKKLAFSWRYAAPQKVDTERWKTDGK